MKPTWAERRKAAEQALEAPKYKQEHDQMVGLARKAGWDPTVCGTHADYLERVVADYLRVREVLRQFRLVLPR